MHLTTESSAIFRPAQPGDLSGLDDFLNKHQASKTFDTKNGSLPYIIVETGLPSIKKKKEVTALQKKVKAIFKQMRSEIDRIQSDNKIPTRGKRATELEAAVPNKLFLRTKAADEAATQIRELAIEAHETEGNFHATEYRDVVDSLFGKLCRSLINGPLSQTSARAVAVSTIVPWQTQKIYHDIFIVYPDVYDEAATTEIAHVLIQDHRFQTNQLNMGVRSNLYRSCKLTKSEDGFRAMIWSLKDLDLKQPRPATSNKRKAEEELENPAGPSNSYEPAAMVPDPKLTPEKKLKPDDAQVESPSVELQSGHFQSLPPPPPQA
ncbi:hypothetical protein BDY24DRAFT_418843 [Mrakia frigida]|uniref:uncharacterized protein n=1 Tax=Mrakia frigida TaxID=29902 RepID=UPI003FCBFAA4